MKTITLFSFGYWSWGSATPQLVRVFDAVEAARGYLPVYGHFDGEPPDAIRAEIQRTREADGYEAQVTPQ